MTAIVFVVLLLSAYWIKTRSIEAAVLDVYLPCFLCIDFDYGYRIPHLPNLNFWYASLTPIAIALVIRYRKEWRFTRSDLWVALFVGGAALTEALHSDLGTAGLVLFDCIFQGVMPYMLGKMLLEKDGMRERFVRRFIYLIAFIAVPTVWEYRMGVNLFHKVEGMVLGSIPGDYQIRGGLVRASATFGGCIQAGTMFGMAFILSLWLGALDKSRAEEPKYLGVRRSTLMTLLTCGGMLMANSRGPMIGAALGFLLARIGKAKNIRMTAIVTLLIVAIGGTIGYVKAQQYTAGNAWEVESQGDKDRADAIYRRMLLDEYKPYIEAGGLLGYGAVARPVVPGMYSIDNAFLNIQLVQGNLGLWTFILMGAEAVLASFLAARRATQRNDISFAICIGASMAGLLLTLTTVWMGPPWFSVFFLLLGWSQSLRQSESAAIAAPQQVRAPFSFRRVIA